MIGTYIIGIGVIVTLMVVWVLVQSFWRKTFSDHISDDDVLAGRTCCSNCGCTNTCENKRRHFQKDKMQENIIT